MSMCNVYNGPITGAEILAGIGLISILASWIPNSLSCRFGMRRFGIWMITFSVVVLAMESLLLSMAMIPDEDNGRKIIHLPSLSGVMIIALISAIMSSMFVYKTLETLFPGFHNNLPFSLSLFKFNSQDPDDDPEESFD